MSAFAAREDDVMAMDDEVFARHYGMASAALEERARANAQAIAALFSKR